MALSKGRREQLEQAKKNAKIKAKQKQNKALIQQFNSTHKNAPKQTISAKGGSRNTRQSTGTTRSTVNKTRMNGSLGNSFGGSKTGGVKTTTDRRANVAHKADAERRQSTTLRQGSSYLTGGSTRKATPYAAAQQVYTPLRSNDRRARAGRAADANRTINARNQMAANTQMNGSLGNSFGGKLPTAARNTQETTTTEDRRARIGRKADEEKKQRQTAIDTLNANSVRWHNTTDETEKNRLHAVNNRIRSMYGMTYEGKTGRTYLPTAGQNVNVSHPVELYSGAEQPQTEFNTQEDKDKRYKEIQSEIDRMKKAYTGLSNFHFGMSENNKADKDAKKQLIKTLEDERNAVTGGTTRKVQAAKSIGNQIVGSPAALAETAQQQSANVEESRKNPEYVRLEQLQEQLELTLAGLPSTDADGKPPAEYMNVYNQLQYVKEQKDKLAVKTTVDPNKWGQQKLTKAAEQKANATTGMTEGKKFAADTAIGVAGNAPQMAASFIPVVGPAIGATWSGVNAAGQRSYELNQHGVAPNESLGRGIVSGVIEAATEKSPMESLANIATKGGKGLVSNIAKQALSEAGEESLGYAANYAADVAANDPNAHFSLSELGQNALGGAAGGAMFGGIGTGIHALRKGVNYLSTARNGNNAAQNQTATVDTQAQTQYTNTNGGVANGINGQQNGNGSIGTGIYANGRVANQPLSAERQNGRGNPGVYEGVLVNRETRQVMNERGMVDFGLRESTGDNASFSRALDAAKASNPHGAFVDSQPAEKLNAEGTRTFMSPDGMAGAAVKRDGDIVGVFKNSTDTRPGAVNDLIITALSNGGNKLDCYGMDLGDKYTQLGFVPVARMEFNPEYATDWKPEFGTPDVIFWMHNGDSAETVARKRGSYQYFDDNYIMSLPTFTDYEAAGQYRDMLLAQQQAGRTQNVNTQNPYDINPMQRAGQTQSAPTLADVRQARNDIMPKLTRAGAETVQTGVQTAPPEITHPMHENAQAAAQQADINPKLTKAEVNAESSVGAAETGFDPYSKMVNDYGAIEPGENPARVVDVPQSTNGTDRVMEHARTVMEAGITSDEVIAALQDEVEKGNLSREVVHDEDAMRRAADRLANTADKAQAVNAWDDIAEGKSAASKDDVAYGQALLAYFNKIGDVQNATRIASDLIVQASRAGQTLQATRMLKKLTPEGRVMAAEKMKENAQKNANDRYGKKAPQIELNDELMHKLQNADSDHVQKALNDVMTDVANQLPNTWWDKFNALRYTSMLTSLPTHIRNILGNVIMRQLAVKPKNVVGTVLESATDKANRLRGGEGIERTKSLFTNKKDRAFARTEFDKMQEELSGSKYDMTSYDALQRAKDNPFSGGILGKLHLDKPLNWINAKNSAALEGEDTLAKRTTYIDSMAQYMKANGLTEADMYNELGGETDALLKAREYATSEALKATFQDANILAKWLQEGEKKLGKAGEIAVGGLVPFKKTPANIIKRGLEYSPLGLLKGTRELVDSVRTGNTTPAQVIDSMSSGLTGTGIMALGYFLGGMGLLRGGDDEDSKKQYFDEMQGEQSYSLNIGGYSYTIDWAAPAVLPLFVGVELQKYMSSKNSGYSIEDFTNALSKITEPVFDLTMMQGINDAIRSASYGKGAQVTALLSSTFTDYFTQGLAPTMLGQVNRSFVDRTRRTTYPDSENNIPDGMEKVMQRTMQKWPGLSKMLPQALDDFGRSQENNPWWENFFSPGYLEKKSSSDAEKALGELYNATGDNSVLPSKPQKTYKDENGKTERLTSDQWLKLTNEGGKISLDAIDKLTKSEAYKQMSNDERIEAVADIYKYAKDVAANKTYGKELDGTTKLVKESGMEPGLYYAYKEMQSNFKASMENYEAFDQTFLAIKNDKSLSEQEKNSLYHNLLIKGNDEATWKKYTEISDKVTAEEYVDAMTQVKYIKGIGDEELEGDSGADKAKAEATEFAKYLDMMGYTGEKRAALEDTFGFYSMIRQDPQNYTFDMLKNEGNTYERDAISAVESSGMSASQYNQIKTLANRLQAGVDYEKGKSGAKKAAQAKIVSQNVNNYDQYAAVMSALGLKRFDSLYSSGGKLPEDSGLNTGINVNRSSASQKTSSAGFVNPTTASNSVVTSGYGGRNAPKTSGGYGSSNHDGIDIGGTGGNLNGQAADSIGGGKVTEVGYDENGYGNYVVVDHGNGYTSLYGHLQKATVKQGETVSAGQQVGVIGSTGNSSGPHLHLRVRKNGQSIDPRTVIPGYK